MFLFTSKMSFCQINYYKLGTDPLRNEKNACFFIDLASNNMPEGYTLKPIIYNRLIKNDTIINYVSLVADKKADTIIVKDKIEFVFKQDSLFLLLNNKLPDFTLSDLNGNPFSSTALLGKPTMICFWSKCCSPCVAEIPQLNKLKEKYGDKFNFIAISEGTCNDDEIIKFLNDNQFIFYQLLNGDSYKKLLKITSLPCNIFVDKYGYVRDIQAGLPFERDMKTGKLTIKTNEAFARILDKMHN